MGPVGPTYRSLKKGVEKGKRRWRVVKAENKYF